MNLNVNEITNALGSVGFPIVACCALFWMINTTMKELTTAISELTHYMKSTSSNKEVERGN